MQDHKQHRDNIRYSAHQLNITPIFIGSQQTQHVELHKDDLDHERQLTRSKHEAHGGEDNHLATAMAHSPRYTTHSSCQRQAWQ
jgi:hypothetical protein